MSATGPLILGASGEIGRSLARVWAMTVPEAGPGLWQHRPGAAAPPVFLAPDVPSLSWDILAEAPPALPAGLSGIVVLAGVTSGDAAALALNTRLAEAALALARAHGIARVLLASSQAVYGPHPGPAQENSFCAPLSAYGAAKLAMEQALAHATSLQLSASRATRPRFSRSIRCASTDRPAAPVNRGSSPLYIWFTISGMTLVPFSSSLKICRSRCLR